MNNTYEDTKNQLSVLLKLQDKGLERIIRNALFDENANIDWEQVKKDIALFMPETQAEIREPEVAERMREEKAKELGSMGWLARESQPSYTYESFGPNDDPDGPDLMEEGDH